MKTLLIVSAAVALSSTFAFADYRHPAPPSFSFALTTGNNTSKIANINVATKHGYVDSTNINVVSQNSGLAIVPIGLGLGRE